jgi:hypothetical protein
MRRIVLEPGRSQLPDYTEVAHEGISTKLAEWDAATAEKENAKRTHTALEQTREQALWADADDDAQREAAGQPAKRTRSHTAEHDKKTEAAAHNLRKATRLEAIRFDALQEALDKHQAEWVKEVDREDAMLNEAWRDAIGAVREIADQRSRVRRVKAMATGEPVPQTQALVFEPRQVQGREWATQQGPDAKPVVQVGDALDELEHLGEEPPEPPAKQSEPTPPPRGIGLNPVNAREHLQREDFAKAMAANPAPERPSTLDGTTPLSVTERQEIIARGRERVAREAAARSEAE